MELLAPWALVVLTALVYPLLGAAYRRTLNHKRREIERLMTRGDTGPRYIEAFGGARLEGTKQRPKNYFPFRGRIV